MLSFIIFMGKKLKKFQLPQSTLQRCSLIFFFLKIKFLMTMFGREENQKEKVT